MQEKGTGFCWSLFFMAMGGWTVDNAARMAVKVSAIMAGKIAMKASSTMVGKIAIIMILLLGVFLAPLEVRATAGIDDPVIKRAMDAGVDAERIERMAHRAQTLEMTPEQLEQILTPVISLAEMDLPYDLLMQKAAEGLAKQIPAPSIRLVLDQMQGNLVRSVAIVDPWMERREVQQQIEAERGVRTTHEAARRYRVMLLEGASQSLQYNADEKLLHAFLEEVAATSIMTKSGLASVAAGLQALSEMPMTQENPGLSIRLLSGAMNAGFTASEIRELPHALRSAHFNNKLPLERITGKLDMRRYEDMPAVHIMEYLFQGNIGGGAAGFQTPDGLRDRESDRGRNRTPPLPPLP